jgi:hypothetical protein
VNGAKFPPGWLSFGLKDYRACDSTYCWFPYESLPPLAHQTFQGDFRWLTPLDPYLIAELEPYRLPEEEQTLILENIRNLTTSARNKGIVLPEPFVAFMSSLEWQARIPSCTACTFELRELLISCPKNEGHFAVRFLNDQQSVCTWYLYLTPTGEHNVIVSRSNFDLFETYPQEFTDEEKLEAIQSTFVCAGSFEEFLYRFWLENHLWFVLNDRYRDLTEPEENYLKHYKLTKTGG